LLRLPLSLLFVLINSLLGQFYIHIHHFSIRSILTIRILFIIVNLAEIASNRIIARRRHHNRPRILQRIWQLLCFPTLVSSFTARQFLLLNSVAQTFVVGATEFLPATATDSWKYTAA